MSRMNQKSQHTSELNKVLDVEIKGKTNETISTYNASADNIQVDDLVNTVYNNWESGEERKSMLEGVAYYNNESKIDKKERFDHCGDKAKKNDRLANTKIHRAYMRKLTRQKINYGFGNPFTITTENDEYKKLLEDEYFTKPFYRQFQTTEKEAIKQGINWLNVYYDEEGKLCYRRVPGDQVKVFWKDIEHTEIDQLIHYYKIAVYQGTEVKDTEYADYYSLSGVIHYVKNDGKFVRDKERPNEEGNFKLPIAEMEDELDDKKKPKLDDKGNKVQKPKIDKDGNVIVQLQEFTWDRIPWVPFKYNSEELSLLRYIKSMADAYENLLSVDIDIILDIPDVIKIIKGYGGTDLEELTDKIAQYRAILVDGDGDVKSLDTTFSMDSSDKILDRLRKDIYEDGSGVDTQNEETGEKSGVALKFLYSDLDLDCRELINEAKLSLEQLMFFIDYDIALKYGFDYEKEEVTFNFDTSGIINEVELIEMINSSRDMIPDKILLPKHPFVEDVVEVEKAIEEEEKEAEKKLQEQMGMFNNNPNDPNVNQNPTNNPIQGNNQQNNQGNGNNPTQNGSKMSKSNDLGQNKQGLNKKTV